eukprot:sb/3462400/
MDDLSIAANFWGLEDPPSSFKMKLPNSKDLSRFQTSQDVSHTTCITINESKFSVNSLVLAQHSEVFEKLIWSGETEITLSRELFVSHMEDAIYVAILFLHGKEITVDQKVLELCYMFASCYQIDALRDMSIGQFVSGITDGSSFFKSFYRLVEIDNKWSDELIVKLILIPAPANNILADIKNHTPKLTELCQRLENRPTPLGKFLWFLQKNRSLKVQQFKQMKFLSKYLTSTGEEADTVRKFLIHIAKGEATGPTRAPHKQGSLGSVNSSPAVSITSEESSSLNDPGSERETVPVVFSNSYDAVKFFQQQMWKHIRKIDDYIAYGQAVSELSKPDNPYALFLYIDSFFIWFLRVPTWRMNEGIRNKFLASFYHELLPAAVVQDIEYVLDSMMRKKVNRPLPSNCSKELSYVWIDIQSVPELQKRLMQDQKLTVRVQNSFNVQIDFRRDPHQGRIATTRPPGHTVRFFYLIGKDKHAERRWMSLAGTSAEKVVNFLQKSTSVAVVLILPKGKQEVNGDSKGKQEVNNCSTGKHYRSVPSSRRVVAFDNAEQVIDLFFQNIRSQYDCRNLHHLSPSPIFTTNITQLHYQLTCTKPAPIGCASSKGFLLTHPASTAPFNVNNTVAMATELESMVTGIMFYEGALSLRYRLTNDFDVHLQLIIETSAPIGTAYHWRTEVISCPMICWDLYHVIPGQFEPLHTRYSHILSRELQRFSPVRFAPVRFAPGGSNCPRGNGQDRTSSFLLDIA